MYGVRLTASATFPGRKQWLPWLLSYGRVNRAEINRIPTRKILPSSANIHQIFDSNSISRITYPWRLRCSLFTLLCLSALLLVLYPFDDTPPLVSPTMHHPLVTSPLIFSEFNLSSKYLQWTNEEDVIAGVAHRLHAWGCALGEAVTLDRTFLFPARFKVPSGHNHGRPDTEKDMRLYLDLPLLHRWEPSLEMARV